MQSTKLQKRLFGTNGVRGIAGKDLTPGLVLTIGEALGTMRKGGIAVGRDTRTSGETLVKAVKSGLLAAGCNVVDCGILPTPALQYLVKEQYDGGAMITASHNPPEYNGYKAYWNDGGQVVAPHDTGIIDEVRKIISVSQIKFNGKKDKIKIIGKETDDLFLNEVLKMSHNPEVISKFSKMGIVYTPIHGTGVKVVPPALRMFGFKNIISVPEQDISDGNFPTVKSPNPEEPGALKMAIAKAVETGAELVIATDPDADRLGIAVKNRKGEFILLNGNQTCLLLIWYILSQYKEKNKYKGNEYIIKTIVTTDLIERIAEDYKVECYNVLTGFKFFAELIRDNEGKKKYIGGGEESYGFLPGEYVRDKDAVASCALIAEATAWAMSNGKTLYEQLLEIYVKYGFYKEKLVNIVRKGKEGADQIKAMMAGYRSNPPGKINNSRILKIDDYQQLISSDIDKGTKKKIELLQSDVLQFFLEDGTKISIRPSGTEPKIKFYFSVNTKLESVDNFEETEKFLDNRIDGIIKDMKLM